jgi:hypothetical protein
MPVDDHEPVPGVSVPLVHAGASADELAYDLVRQEIEDVPGRQAGLQELAGCPDDGACHHLCRDRCWRVRFCGPLSGYGDDWTEQDRARHDPDGVLREPAGRVAVVHACPPDGESLMPCCGRTPFEALADRITIDPGLVTCPGKDAS